MADIEVYMICKDCGAIVNDLDVAWAHRDQHIHLDPDREVAWLLGYRPKGQDMKGILIPVEGDMKIVDYDPDNIDREDERSLQGLVGGWIEMIQSRSAAELMLVVDEEGRLKRLPINEEASKYSTIPQLVGNVVMVASNSYGALMDVPDWVVKTLLTEETSDQKI